jgi:putative hydrolase of the HAD superfamily
MIAAIAFDADDTLWHNETIFEEMHQRLCRLLEGYHPAEQVEAALFSTEMRNLELFGYGVKGFTLSAIETALELTAGRLSGAEVREILEFAREMLSHPVQPLEGVEETLAQLGRRYPLLLITKGDLRDQERKIARSGLARHFNHWEIVSEKNVETYARILERHRIAPEAFVMVGNSLKSDILPVLDLGGHGVYIPYHLLWKAESANAPAGASAARFHPLASIRGLPELLNLLQDRAG